MLCVPVSVYASDSMTFVPQVKRLRDVFGIQSMVMVRSHIFLCMSAYYVEWHMREVWRELMFADEDQAAKLSRGPVVSVQRSDEAMTKVQSHMLDDGAIVDGVSN
jgi:hypothetical protein